MASEQFIIETHLKLNPRSKTKHYEDMTEKQKAVVLDLVAQKHSLTLTCNATGESVTLDLSVLRNVMTSASLAAMAGMKKQEDKSIRDIQNIGGGWDEEAMADWMINYRYYVEQKATVDKVEALLESLRDASCQEGFYV